MADVVLVVAAHPDDEILGCGGTIARHVLSGDKCHSLILAEGETSRTRRRDPEARLSYLDKLQTAAKSAASLLGAEEPRFVGLPDNRLDGIELLEVVKEIEATVDALRPSVVYTHHGGDLNVDHRIVCEAVLVACRPFPEQSVRAIYAFETVSSSEWCAAKPCQSFVPTHYVSVNAVLERKIAALDCYKEEMRAFPHARSKQNIETLARYRGASVGLEAAEAFVTLRELVL